MRHQQSLRELTNMCQYGRPDRRKYTRKNQNSEYFGLQSYVLTQL